MNIIQIVEYGIVDCPTLIESDEEAFEFYKQQARYFGVKVDGLTKEELFNEIEALNENSKHELYWWKV